MNKRITDNDVQEYISSHLTADVHKTAMTRSPFKEVSGTELAGQISAKNKCRKKLPAWFETKGIYYPALLSIEQCSSETTARYKAGLALKGPLLDLTGGFGVDSHYFAKVAEKVTYCEINEELSEIAAYNARVFGQGNTNFLAINGLEFLKSSAEIFDTIYVDPARRSSSGKVFMLKDCTPDVVGNLELMLSKAKRIIIKTAPLLDISAGLKEFYKVAEVHIISLKNECKELLWILDQDKPVGQRVKIRAVTLNEVTKQFSFYKEEIGDITEGDTAGTLAENGAPKAISTGAYLYEPDAALMKSGAFELISSRYQIEKLDRHTQLYTSKTINPAFPGRIFRIRSLLSAAMLKKQKNLTGNVIVRNYPDKAENLVKKYRIRPDREKFIIFTQGKIDGHLIIDAEIIQYY